MSQVQWFIMRDGSQAGPFNNDLISQWARSGWLHEADLLWQAGWPEWRPAGQVFGFKSGAPSTPNQVRKRTMPPPPPQPSHSGIGDQDTLHVSDRHGRLPTQLALIITVVTAIGGVLDFLKPVTENLLGIGGTSVFFIAGLIGLLFVFWLARRHKSSMWSAQLRTACWILAAMMVVGAIPLAAGFVYPSVRKSGAIAQVSEGAAGFQKLLLEKINLGTEKTIEAIKGVETTVKTLKRETSSDPRKELANLGIPWTIESFQAALRNGDRRAVELFMRGGYPIDPQTAVQFLEHWFKPQLAADLVKFTEQFDKKLCSFVFDDAIALIKNLQSRDKSAFILAVCGAAPVRKKIEWYLDIEQTNKCIAHLVARHKVSSDTSSGIDFDSLRRVWDDGSSTASRGKVSKLEAGSLRRMSDEGWSILLQQADLWGKYGANPQQRFSKIAAERSCRIAFGSAPELTPNQAADMKKLLAALPHR